MTTGRAVLSPPEAPIWRLAAVSWMSPARRTQADGVLQRLPMAAILLAQVLLSMRLHNTAFEDEALYINTGHALIAHWFHGTPTGDPGSYFSGAPAAYPVIAAALDSVGGLLLVRLFSLLCMMTATIAIRSITRRLFGSPTAGLLASAVFVLVGPVMFLGAFATFDALCLMCLAMALWLGVAGGSGAGRAGVCCNVGVGVALAFAATLKYTGAVFIPPVLLVVFLAGGGGGRALIRAATAGLTAIGLLATGLILWGGEIEAGIKFTTTSRRALLPGSFSELLGFVAQDIGIVFVLAVVGVACVPRTARTILLAITLLLSACLLPASQMRIGEVVSFEKHLAYSALFLAPLVGMTLLELSRRGPKLLGVLVLAFVICIGGLSRSMAMYTVWPNVSQVVNAIGPGAPSGEYLSTSSDALAYYTKNSIRGAHWNDQYGIFGAGSAAIRAAIDNRDYQYVIFHSGTSGNPTADGYLQVLRSSLESSPDYQLVTAPFPTRRYAVEDWFIYRLK